jgi:hypothetical protein
VRNATVSSASAFASATCGTDLGGFTFGSVPLIARHSTICCVATKTPEVTGIIFSLTAPVNPRALKGILGKPADLRTDDRVASLEEAKSQASRKLGHLVGKKLRLVKI